MQTIAVICLSITSVHVAGMALSTPAKVTTATIPAVSVPLLPQEQDEPVDSNSLTPLQRVGRAVSFYSAAVPVFASYKGLDLVHKFKRTILNKDVSDAEIDEEFDELHEWGSEIISEKIKELKGFYVKTGQIISTRVDIFPPQYTSKLAMTQDKLDPVPTAVVKDVVRKELMNGADLDELFLEFDEVPLGSASIAQVHRAVLLDGREVAVKVQRPGIKAKLLGDIRNLQNFAKLVGDSLLIDYYKIFVEMEKTLQFELDFLHEAQATAKVAAAVAHSPSNKPQAPPVTVPLAIPGLVTTRVMVMEFVKGKALSTLAAEMTAKGVEPGSPESKLLGRKLLSSLTDAYASMIFGSGIIHGDPHPGNIFIVEGGEVALLDCGQVKQINTAARTTLANLIIMVNNWETTNRKLNLMDPDSDEKPAVQVQLNELTKKLAASVRSFGVYFKEGAGDECAAAVAILLFGSTDTKLPGGYAGEEISPDSPIVQVTEFPSEFILLGRATVMIKGIAGRLGLTWGLSDRWARVARETVASSTQPDEFLPIWSVAPPAVATTSVGANLPDTRLVSGKKRIRFADVLRGFIGWARLARDYSIKKTVRLAAKYLPESFNRKAVRFIALIAQFFQQRTDRRIEGNDI